MATTNEKLVRARQRAGLSQQQLAALVGVKQPSIQRIEQGRQFPRQGLAERIARALGVSVRTVYGLK